ncbi:MAG: epoxide hydrolase N-terminal domain-containing protein, partial [Bryobacteraceae bacterium]|nr:epoxide hydrolase N-terminal domain-containing protein [Bryobacteraceae bacterium]
MISTNGPKPFTIAFSDEQLADLKMRLSRTRWPDQIPGSGWGYGMNSAVLR